MSSLLLILVISLLLSFIETQKPTSNFQIVSNFSLPVKDNNGLIYNKLVNTYIVNFQGLVGGMEIDEVFVSKNGQSARFRILVPVIGYPMRQTDIASAVPQSQLYSQQDVGFSKIASAGSSPPAHLSTGGLVNTDNNPAVNGSDGSGAFSIMASVRGINLMSSRTVGNEHGRNLKEAIIEKVNKAKGSYGYDIVDRMMIDLDRYNNPHTTWQTWWETGAPQMNNCGGHSSYGIPCTGETQAFLEPILTDDNKITCMASMWVSWMKSISEFGPCSTWPIHMLPKRDPNHIDSKGKSDTWCDLNPASPYNWVQKAIAFINKDDHRQVRFPLSYTEPNCSLAPTTWDGNYANPAWTAAGGGLQIANDLADGESQVICRIDAKKPTKIDAFYTRKSKAHPEGLEFNMPGKDVDGFPSSELTDPKYGDLVGTHSYLYYDSSDCPCLPTDLSDTNYWYTCPANPWVNDIDRKGGIPQGQHYSVGVNSKCSPFIRADPEAGGFCVPFIEDAAMFDYSVQVCETVRPSWPSECPFTATACFAAGIFCPAFDLDECPTVQVCIGSFTAGSSKGTSQEQQGDAAVILASQLAGTEALSQTAAKLVNYATDTLLPNLMKAAQGFTNMTLAASAVSMALREQERLQDLAQATNNQSLQQLQANDKNAAQSQTVQFGALADQINKTAALFQAVTNIDPIFLNQTKAMLNTAAAIEANNSQQATLQIINNQLVYDALHDIVAVVQKEIVSLPLFRLFRDDQQQTATRIRSIYAKYPLISDYNKDTGYYGQAILPSIPDQYKNITNDAYWPYALEWISGPINNLGSTVVRVHQQHFVEVCTTTSMLNYTKVTVTIDQFRDQIRPGNCWITYSHSSCLWNGFLGAAITTITSSRGHSGQYPLFQEFQSPTYNSLHNCVGGSYILHNSSSVPLTYAYQVDDAILTLARWPNLVSLPNSPLWPGYAIFRGGLLGNIWQSAYIPTMATSSGYTVPVQIDSFSRQLVETGNSFAAPYGITAYVNTMYGLLSTSYSLGIGSSTLLILFQATTIGRLPRYGVHQQILKTKQQVNATAARTAPLRSANSTSSNSTAVDILSNLLSDPAQVSYLLGSLGDFQLQGYNNVLQYDILSVSPISEPIIVYDISDAVSSAITFGLSLPFNSSTLTVDQQMNEQVFANATFAKLTAVIDENKVFNSIASQLIMAGPLSCILFHNGCPTPQSNAFRMPVNGTLENGGAVPTTRLNYLYDIESIDMSVYARTWYQARGKVGIIQKALGEELVRSMFNKTFYAQLSLAPFRNASFNATADAGPAGLPDFGRSILSYLNYSGIEYNTSIKTETDIEQILFEQAFNQGLDVTSSNADMLQWLVGYLPFFASVSLSSYLTSVSCNRFIPAPPFNDWQLWDCVCMKPISERQTVCRIFDLFYPKVPVAWLKDVDRGGYNPDNWDHLYLQPKNSTIEFTVELPDVFIERVAINRGPCPTNVVVGTSSFSAGGLPLLTYNRPNYSQNVTLRITMQIASENFYNETFFTPDSIEQDCAVYAAKQQFSQYNSDVQKWNISNTYLYLDTNNTAPINIILPSSTCIVMSIIIERINSDDPQTCFSWTTSAVPNTAVPNGDLGITINELQSRNVISSFASTNSIQDLLISNGAMIQNGFGTVDVSGDASQFVSSQAIIDSYISGALQPPTNGSSGSSSSSSSNTTTSFNISAASIGDIVILGNNNTDALNNINVTLKGTNLPTNTTIQQNTPSQATLQAQFEAQYGLAWGDANSVQQLAFNLSQSLAQKTGLTQGAGVSQAQIQNFYNTVINSFILNDGKWSEFIAAYEETSRKYNLTATVANALANQPVFFTITQDKGIKCLNEIHRLQVENPDAWAQVIQMVKDSYALAVIANADKTVTPNPFSQLNGSLDGSNKDAVWWAIWIVLMIMVIILLAIIGSTSKVQSGRAGCFCLANFSTVMCCKSGYAYRNVKKPVVEPPKATIGGIIDRQLNMKNTKVAQSSYIPTSAEQIEEAKYIKRKKIKYKKQIDPSMFIDEWQGTSI
jgi:hypothetical protein